MCAATTALRANQPVVPVVPAACCVLWLRRDMWCLQAAALRFRAFVEQGNWPTQYTPPSTRPDFQHPPLSMLRGGTSMHATKKKYSKLSKRNTNSHTAALPTPPHPEFGQTGNPVCHIPRQQHALLYFYGNQMSQHVECAAAVTPLLS